MDVVHGRLSRVWVSEPPYRSARLKGAEAPPVGAILIVAGDEPGTTLMDCLAYQRTFPWCPACIACSALVRDPQALRALEPRPGITALIPSHAGEIDDLVATAAAAVGARIAPGPATLAWYVEQRTGVEGASRPLRLCFGDDAVRPQAGTRQWTLSRSTLARHVQTLGPLTPRQWAALAQLAAAPRPSRCRSAEGLALELELDPRTLRRRVTALLGWDIRRYAATLGWEPVLEQVLRRHFPLISTQPDFRQEAG